MNLQWKTCLANPFCNYSPSFTQSVCNRSIDNDRSSREIKTHDSESRGQEEAAHATTE